jgi:cobalamin biosynthesis protein CbiD
MRAPAIGIVLGVSLLLATGCITPLTEADLEEDLERAAASIPSLGRKRVIPIYAETRMEAWALLADAKSDPSSQMSYQVSRGLAAAARRGYGVVVGGPYPALTDQVVRNALTLHRERPLGGLKLLFVSAKPPSEALLEAAKHAEARLRHREFR